MMVSIWLLKYRITQEILPTFKKSNDKHSFQQANTVDGISDSLTYLPSQSNIIIEFKSICRRGWHVV